MRSYLSRFVFCVFFVLCGLRFTVSEINAAPSPETVILRSDTHKPLNPAIDLSGTTTTFADGQIPQVKVNGLTTSLSSEASARAAAVSSEASTRSAADTAEATARSAADTAVATAAAAALATHVGDTSNPHATTKAQVGLANADNTSDVNKPVSTAQAAADTVVANNAAAALATHTGNTSNPHATTKAQVGLGNADNTSDVNKPVSTATQTALNLKANDSATVHNTGSETIAGVKNFASAPIVPAAAFPETAVSGLTSDLTAKVNNTAILSTLTALAAPADGVAARTTGAFTANDGGNSNFIYSATSTATADGYSVIQPSGVSGAGRWLLQPTNNTVTAAQFGAIPSSVTGLGTISSSSTTLTLAAAGDFKNGQKIKVVGAGPAAVYAAPGIVGLTGAGSCTGTCDGTYSYEVIALDANGGYSAISAPVSTTTGPHTYSALTPLMGLTVSWTAPSGSPPAYAVYAKYPGSSDFVFAYIVTGATSWKDDGSSNAPGNGYSYLPQWLPATNPSAAQPGFLITSIVSGAGTTSLTLANAATSSVTSGMVTHDETATLTAFLNYALARGSGTYLLPKGTYTISGALPTINVSGIRIEGDGYPEWGSQGLRGLSAEMFPTSILYDGPYLSGSMLTIAAADDATKPALSGNELRGITFMGSGLVDQWVTFTSVQKGFFDVRGEECQGRGFQMVTNLNQLLPPNVTNNVFKLFFSNRHSGGLGVFVGGNTDVYDTCLNDFWVDGYFSSNVGLRLAYCDHNRYREVSMGYSGHGVAPNYAISCKAKTTLANLNPAVDYEIFDQLQVNAEILLSEIDDGGNSNPPLGLQFRNTEPNTVFTVSGTVAYRAWNRKGVSLQPPIQTILTTASTSPYQVPAGCTRIEVEGWGAGGGGASSGNIGSFAGSNGGDTLFGSGPLMRGNGGLGGSLSGAGNAGGAASGGDININGAGGTGAQNLINAASGSGGSGPYGGAGRGVFNHAGDNAAANSGSGGSGGGASGAAGVTPVGSGAAGGYFRKTIFAPNSSYSFTIGAGGAGAISTGTGHDGFSGGNGADGMIIIRAFFD
jgi:hypothetical protein